MAESTANSEHECRHCSGLCAGRAAKCPYCRRWLRREPAELVGADQRHDHFAFGNRPGGD